MDLFLITIGVGMLLIMLLPLVRVVFGPTVIDRIMGVNVIGTKTTVLLVIIGTIYQRVEMFVDIALAYALLNFVATLGASRFFLHRRSLEADPAGRVGHPASRAGGAAKRAGRSAGNTGSAGGKGVER
jgi:multicomponent Na+:H+ antiporter subunit F